MEWPTIEETKENKNSAFLYISNELSMYLHLVRLIQDK